MMRLLRALGTLPQPLPNKETLSHLLQEHGVDRKVEDWILGMLRRDAGKSAGKAGYRLNFCVDTAQDLLRDYTHKDCWDTMLNAGSDVHMVIGSYSERWDTELRGRLDSAAADGALQVHQLAKSGHWMHSDEPEAVANLIAARLNASAGQ